MTRSKAIPPVARRAPVGLLAAGLLLAAGGQAQAASSADSCHELGGLRLAKTQVVEVRYDAGGRDVSVKDPNLGGLAMDLPASCRVKLLITPAAGSEIRSEVWLPIGSAWNGRLWSTDNGGLGGAIGETSMAVALSRGYATSGTDTGHPGDGFGGAWALHQPEKRIDYGYRAIHETATAAKAAIRRLYGRDARWAYFSGGSNGGREALQEAQRYPKDYDGLEVGAPAFDGANTLMVWSWLEQQLQKPGAWIPPSKQAAIASAAMAACDSADGLKDGLIVDPRSCHLEPSRLLCTGPETDDCLTAPQVASLTAIYRGPGGRDPAGYAYYGYSAGSETNWIPWIIAKTPDQSLVYRLAIEIQRYLAHDDASWSLDRFQLARDPAETFRRMGRFYEALDVDLSGFAAHGGKIIMYHGWADPALQPQLSIDYYERVRARMGAKKTAGFMSLYMVPGMSHVTGGKGPNTFGQTLAPPPGASAATNIGSALERWVEQGVAPGPILGREYLNEPGALYSEAGRTPGRTRPICPYPQVERYKGSGDPNKAENFLCAPALGLRPR